MLQRFVETVGREIEDLRARFRDLANPTLRAISATLRTRLKGPDSVRIALIAAHAESLSANARLRTVFSAHWQRIEAETADRAGALAIWCAIDGLQFFSLFNVWPATADDARTLANRLEGMIDALAAAARSL